MLIKNIVAISSFSKPSSAVVLPVIPDISTAFYWQFKIIRVQTQLFESWFFGVTVFFSYSTPSPPPGACCSNSHIHTTQDVVLASAEGWVGVVVLL